MNRTFADSYRGTVGMLSWMLNRISGVVLTVYMLFYLYTLRAAQDGPQSFNQMLQSYQTPFWKALHLLVLLALFYHTFNGIRLLAFDANRGLRYQRSLFWIAFTLAIAAFLFSAVLVLRAAPAPVGVQ